MKYLLVLLGGLEVADGVLTRWAVTSGIARELNPLVAGRTGGLSFLLVKAAGGVATAAILWALYRRFPKIALVSANTLVVFYTAVLVWNLGALV